MVYYFQHDYLKVRERLSVRSYPLVVSVLVLGGYGLLSSGVVSVIPVRVREIPHMRLLVRLKVVTGSKLDVGLVLSVVRVAMPTI